jgi:hypothetical protein
LSDFSRVLHGVSLAPRDREQPGGINEAIMDRNDSGVFDSFRGSSGGAGRGGIGNPAAFLEQRKSGQ